MTNNNYLLHTVRRMVLYCTGTSHCETCGTVPYRTVPYSTVLVPVQVVSSPDVYHWNSPGGDVTILFPDQKETHTCHLVSASGNKIETNQGHYCTSPSHAHPDAAHDVH